MGTKKWSEIRTLGKATVADRVEARAELDEEIRSYHARELLSHGSKAQPATETHSDQGQSLAT